MTFVIDDDGEVVVGGRLCEDNGTRGFEYVYVNVTWYLFSWVCFICWFIFRTPGTEDALRFNASELVIIKYTLVCIVNIGYARGFILTKNCTFYVTTLHMG